MALVGAYRPISTGAKTLGPRPAMLDRPRRSLRGGRLSCLRGLVALLVTLAWASFAVAAPTFPTLTGRVVDDAHVLPATTQAALTEKLAALEKSTSRQLVVVTLHSLGGYQIEDYGYQLLRHWGIGQKGLNNGAILIVAPTEHKVRIEVGYGLEPILTDALSSQILQRDAIPRFKAGDTPGAVTAATDSLIAQLSLDPSAAEAQVPTADQLMAPADGKDGVPKLYPDDESDPSPLFDVLQFLPIFAVGAVIILALLRRRGIGGRGGGLGTAMFLGGSGGWSGSDGSGGSGGGDDFSGGGGSGGGGGADASW